MTAKELAALLNGREYRNEITKAEASDTKASGLVVVFGSGDVLMVFRGAIVMLLKANHGLEVVAEI